MKKIVLLLAVVGYFTATLFYWPYGRVNDALARYSCPLCPNIDTFGVSATSSFVRSTLVSGTINTAIFLAIGLVVLGASRLVRRSGSNR
jgi:hypothetical protein